jgi:hypothetical protein
MHDTTHVFVEAFREDGSPIRNKTERRALLARVFRAAGWGFLGLSRVHGDETARLDTDTLPEWLHEDAEDGLCLGESGRVVGFWEGEGGPSGFDTPPVGTRVWVVLP